MSVFDDSGVFSDPVELYQEFQSWGDSAIIRAVNNDGHIKIYVDETAQGRNAAALESTFLRVAPMLRSIGPSRWMTC